MCAGWLVGWVGWLAGNRFPFRLVSKRPPRGASFCELEVEPCCLSMGRSNALVSGWELLWERRASITEHMPKGSESRNRRNL